MTTHRRTPLLTWEDEARYDPRPTYSPDAPPPLGPVTPEVYRRVYGQVAVAGANEIIDVLTRRNRAWHLYTPDDLACSARLVYRACLKHQLAGGQPTDLLNDFINEIATESVNGGSA